MLVAATLPACPSGEGAYEWLGLGTGPAARPMCEEMPSGSLGFLWPDSQQHHGFPHIGGPVRTTLVPTHQAPGQCLIRSGAEGH